MISDETVKEWKARWEQRAQIDLDHVQQKEQNREQRRVAGQELRELLTAFQDGQVDVEGLRATFQAKTQRDWKCFGFSGTGFAMALNMWVKNLPDQGALSEALCLLLRLPDDPAEAESRIGAFFAFLQRAIGRGEVERRSVLPYNAANFASACWHVQALDRWPPFYPMTRKSLRLSGLWSKSRDPAIDYRRFVEIQWELMEQLDLGLYDIEALSTWTPPKVGPVIEDPPDDEDEDETPFMDEEELERALAALERRRCVILKGPPGTGKTFLAQHLAALLDPDAEVRRIQLHPSYGYEDLVRGYRPAKTGFELQDGPLLKACFAARKGTVVVILDEINRADVSRVFGELFSLLEVDKRQERYALQLANPRPDEPPFFIPPDLYLIGTMNTADRSIAMVDFALRRRFAFFDLPPAFHTDAFREHLLEGGVPDDLVDHLATIFVDLNHQIEEDDDLGKGFCVGHSYFCRPPESDHEEWYRSILETEIGPLLDEYWFTDKRKAYDALAKLHWV